MKPKRTEIPFSEVRFGETFFSKKTKREFGGIKIQPISFDPGPHTLPTAIIMTDHTGCPANDKGRWISFDDNTLVEVERLREYRITASRIDIPPHEVATDYFDPEDDDIAAKEWFDQMSKQPEYAWDHLRLERVDVEEVSVHITSTPAK